MKKLTVVLLVSLAIVSLLVGCSRQGGRGTNDATLIGIAMPETHIQRWVRDGNLLKVEAESRGYRTEVQWAGNADQPTQNQQIQGFLTRGAKAIIVACINDDVGPVISEANHNGVAIIAYDRIIPKSDDYNHFITFNNFKVGVLQAESIVARLNLEAATARAPKFITLFAGSPTDGNAFFSFDGAMSVLNPYIDRGVLRVIGPYPKSSADTANFQRIATEGGQASIAKTRMENLLSSDAKDVVLDAVLAPNDTLARAILEACKADAKYQTRLPVTCGQDAEFDSALSIRNDEQYSTVFKDTARLAEAAIILADAILKSQTPYIPGAVLATGDLAEIGNTEKKYVQTYLLDPILVTGSNLNIPVDAGFYEDAQAAQLR